MSQISGPWKGGDPISCPDPGTNGSTLNQVRMFARLLCLSRLPSPGRGPHSSPPPSALHPQSWLQPASSSRQSLPPLHRMSILGHLRQQVSTAGPCSLGGDYPRNPTGGESRRPSKTLNVNTQEVKITWRVGGRGIWGGELTTGRLQRVRARSSPSISTVPPSAQ